MREIGVLTGVGWNDAAGLYLWEQGETSLAHPVFAHFRMDSKQKPGTLVE